MIILKLSVSPYACFKDIKITKKLFLFINYCTFKNIQNVKSHLVTDTKIKKKSFFKIFSKQFYYIIIVL